MIKLAPVGENTARRSGETLEIDGIWELDSLPSVVEARLFWYTIGEGPADMETVAKQPVRRAPQQGSNRFRFELPVAPYSFGGTLFSLGWAVELAVDREIT